MPLPRRSHKPPQRSAPQAKRRGCASARIWRASQLQHKISRANQLICRRAGSYASVTGGVRQSGPRRRLRASDRPGNRWGLWRLGAAQPALQRTPSPPIGVLAHHLRKRQTAASSAGCRSAKRVVNYETSHPPSLATQAETPSVQETSAAQNKRCRPVGSGATVG